MPLQKAQINSKISQKEFTSLKYTVCTIFGALPPAFPASSSQQGPWAHLEATNDVANRSPYPVITALGYVHVYHGFHGIASPCKLRRVARLAADMASTRTVFGDGCG